MAAKVHLSIDADSPEEFASAFRSIHAALMGSTALSVDQAATREIGKLPELAVGYESGKSLTIEEAASKVFSETAQADKPAAEAPKPTRKPRTPKVEEAKPAETPKADETAVETTAADTAPVEGADEVADTVWEDKPVEGVVEKPATTAAGPQPDWLMPDTKAADKPKAEEPKAGLDDKAKAESNKQLMDLTDEVFKVHGPQGMILIKKALVEHAGTDRISQLDNDPAKREKVLVAFQRLLV